MKYHPVYPEDDGDQGGFREDRYESDSGGFVPDSVVDDEPVSGFVSEYDELRSREEAAFYRAEAAAAEEEETEPRARRRKKASRRKKRLRVVLLLLIAALLGELLWLYGRWARPPEINREITNQTEDAPFRSQAGRKDGCYTFLIAGKDKAAGLTDTVLVGMMDTKAHTLRFVSIPRDTAVNIEWSPKKINQYYPAAENRGEDGVEALIAGVENIIGYRVDCYAVFDVDVFIDLVDTMGGVYFDVPLDMNYEDPEQDLFIHVSQGYQKLNGYDTMCVFRFRSAYQNGDIGRLNVQHDLLKSIASQMLSLGNIPNVKKLVDLYEKNVITNLTSGNVMYFIQEFLKMNEDDIVFETIPANYGGEVHGMSYVIIYLDQWLTYLNQYLNPYTTDITVDNVDIIFAASSGNLTATTGTIRGRDRW